MFFSKSARILAIVALVIGLTNVLLGFAIANEWLGPYEAALARYTTRSSSGQVIDRGIYAILVAVALGTLADINFSIRKAIEAAE